MPPLPQEGDTKLSAWKNATPRGREKKKRNSVNVRVAHTIAPTTHKSTKRLKRPLAITSMNYFLLAYLAYVLDITYFLSFTYS